MELGYQDPAEGFQRCSSVKLGTMLVSETDAALRRAAWEGLRSIEGHVLQNGFLDVVRKRNQLGRMLGVPAGKAHFETCRDLAAQQGSLTRGSQCYAAWAAATASS